MIGFESLQEVSLQCGHLRGKPSPTSTGLVNPGRWMAGEWGVFVKWGRFGGLSWGLGSVGVGGVSICTCVELLGCGSSPCKLVG